MRIRIVVTIFLAAITCAGCSSIARRAALPGSYLQPPACNLPDSSDYEVVRSTLPNGTPIVLQFSRATDVHGEATADWAARRTVLFCYGNRMSIAGSQGIVRDLRRMGVNVVVPEYPGYGMSGGTPSEEGCYAAADTAYDFLVRTKHLGPQQIIAAGYSIGGGVATDLASRRPVAGLLLVVPFTRVSDVGRDTLSWYLRWAAPIVARHVAFDNLQKLPKVTAPVLLIEASRDQITSHQRSAQLSAAAKAPLTQVQVDADHDGAWAAGVEKVKEWLRGETYPRGGSVSDEHSHR